METGDPFAGTALEGRTRRRLLSIVFFGLTPMTAAITVRYGSLAAWPLAALLVTLLAGLLAAAAAAAGARATGRRWPWLPLGLAGATLAASCGLAAARLLGGFQ